MRRRPLSFVISVVGQAISSPADRLSSLSNRLKKAAFRVIPLAPDTVRHGPESGVGEN
jgi:hypothetical protein